MATSISLLQRVAEHRARHTTFTRRTRHWPDRLTSQITTRNPCIGDLRGNAVPSPSDEDSTPPDGTRKQPVELSRPKGRSEDEGTHH